MRQKTIVNSYWLIRSEFLFVFLLIYSSPPIDNIAAVVIFWRLGGKIIRTVYDAWCMMMIHMHT